MGRGIRLYIALAIIAIFLGLAGYWLFGRSHAPEFVGSWKSVQNGYATEYNFRSDGTGNIKFEDTEPPPVYNSANIPDMEKYKQTYFGPATGTFRWKQDSRTLILEMETVKQGYTMRLPVSTRIYLWTVSEGGQTLTLSGDGGTETLVRQ